MNQVDTPTPATALLRSLADTVARIAEMQADEDRFRARQWGVGILAPMRNHRFRAAVRVKKATRAALFHRIIQACEAGQLAEIERIATAYQALRDDLALDPGDRKSERQRDIGRRRDAAEQLVLSAVEGELRHRRLI